MKGEKINKVSTLKIEFVSHFCSRVRSYVERKWGGEDEGSHTVSTISEFQSLGNHKHYAQF